MEFRALFSLTLMLLLSACILFNPEETEETEKVEMIFIEGGTFQMGNIWDEDGVNGKPVHTVTLSSFYIGKYEVTQALYKEIIGDTPISYVGDSIPVDNVSWYRAVEFCNKLSDTTDLQKVYSIDGANVTADFTKNGYRLPTEAEWEYAARSGGRDDRKYSGTNYDSELSDFAWYYQSNSEGGTHAIGTKQPNDLGIYDMSGNVWEWCWDWYAPYPSEAQTNPIGPSEGSTVISVEESKVMRGGCESSVHFDCCTYWRRGYAPYKSNYARGFRIARNAE